MTPTRRHSLARFAYGGAALLLLGYTDCAGPKFETSSSRPYGSEAQGGEAGSGHVPGDDGGEAADGGAQSGGAHASGTTSAAPATPCGHPRTEPDHYRVELCVPKGTFTMGSSSENLGAGHADHTPAHDVTLSAFLIDAYEVTVARFRECVRAGSCSSPAMDPLKGCTYTADPSGADDLPVSCVTAGEASTFCGWDGGRRLPTEAEWERAASNDERANFPWGTTFDCERAVIGAASSCKGQYLAPQSVGSRPLGRSALGAFDMSGNVAEWVKDFAGSYPSEAVTDPTGPTTGVTRIARGGSFLSIPVDGQVFARSTHAGSTVGPIGFRCAREAPAQ